jgi:CheY-like chemotaxis protein
VDDIEANLTVLKGLLAPYQMKITSCTSGMDAIELIKEQKCSPAERVDFVLMDHMMPGMDGVETTAAIREWEEPQRKNVIIALTANAISGMKEMFLAKGFDDYLSKPIDIVKLDGMVSKWIPRGKKITNLVPFESNMNEVHTGNITQPGKPRKQTALSEMEAEVQLDILKHYKKHFEENQAADEAYLGSFADLVKALQNRITGNAKTAETSAALIAAADRGDTGTIAAELPGYYEALLQHHTKQIPQADEDFPRNIEKLKRVLQNGDKAAKKETMAALYAMPLTGENRELFVALYDLILMDETLEAIKRIEQWQKK